MFDHVGHIAYTLTQFLRGNSGPCEDAFTPSADVAGSPSVSCGRSCPKHRVRPPRALPRFFELLVGRA
jgi:hypothetical protein